MQSVLQPPVSSFSLTRRLQLSAYKHVPPLALQSPGWDSDSSDGHPEGFSTLSKSAKTSTFSIAQEHMETKAQTLKAD